MTYLAIPDDKDSSWDNSDDDFPYLTINIYRYLFSYKFSHSCTCKETGADIHILSGSKSLFQ